MKKLAIITTHPIQYNAPMFAMLQQRGDIAVKVFYTWGETVLQSKFDPGFNKSVEWDIPLLEGYEYEFLQNIATEKGSHHYRGIINPAIIEKITKWRPHALLIYGWKFHSHLKVIRHFKNKIPVWFRGDSTLLNEKGRLKSIVRKFFLHWVYKHIDVAFYTGAHNRAYFLKNGLKEHQLIKAFHAVDNNRFENIDERYSLQALQWKTRLNIKPADFVFLYAGKLESVKNTDSLLKAFTALAKSNVHLIIAGNGPEEAGLKYKYSGIKNIHFIDFQNQQLMPVVYQLCHVFVLPSRSETWGLGINEAMAAGKIILTSDKCGGAVDLVKDGENGFIFKADDAGDLVSKMQILIKSPHKIQAMQQSSRQRIEKFTFMEFVNAIETQMFNGKNS